MERFLFWIQGPYNEAVLQNNFSVLKSIGIDCHFVVCTNQNVEEKIDGIEYVFIADPGPDCNEFIKLNYSRQFSTTNRIISYSDLKSFNYIFKLRSDILIMSKKKFLGVLKIVKSNKSIVVSSYSTMHRVNAFEYNYHISDWLYFGSTNLVRDFIAKNSRVENVLKLDKNKIYLEHWVGVETCEQAMIDPTFFHKHRFYKVIIPINLFSFGLELTKYNYLFIPKTFRQLKTVIFARLSNYTQNDWLFIKYVPLMKYVIPIFKKTFLKNIILK
jgi:hypothetical protein